MSDTTFTFPSPCPTALAIVSLVRTDTGGTVGGSISGSGATWDLTVTEPSPGLNYAYTLQATYATGATPNFTGFIAGTATPIGQYATMAYWGAFDGMINLILYADKDSTGKLNVVSIQAAMDYAAGEINDDLATMYAIPLTPVTQKVMYWSAVIGRGWLYRGGYGQWEGDKVSNRFAAEEAEVRRQMRQVLNPPRCV